MIRCNKCKGQKKYAGIGGIFKDCEVCDSTGKVSLGIELEASEQIDKQLLKQTLPKKKITNETISATEAFKSMGVPDSVIQEVITHDLSEASDAFPAPIEVEKAIDSALAQSCSDAPIDEFMQAVIDEPRMDPIAWMEKYKHVDRLFGINIEGKFGEITSKVQRAALRANYATNQVIAERIVDLGVSQDAASRDDPEFAAYQAREKKLMAEKSKKGKANG